MTSASSKYFKENAVRWDSLRSGYFSEEVRNAAIARAYLRPEMVVADVGAGTGFVSAGLAPLVLRVIALDGSQEMLAVARQNLSHFDNVEFKYADGQSLPLPDNTLDAVFANMYLHHCVDPLSAIREMVRILRPGGRLVITDMDSHPYAWLKEEMTDVWQGFERGQMRGWFAEAGLVNLIVDCSGQSCCATSEKAENTAAEGREARISVFVAVGSKPVAGVEVAVQQDYAAHARGEGVACCSTVDGGASCCGGTDGTTSFSFVRGYSLNEQRDVPSGALEIALGCGNPTAIASLQAGEVVLDIGSGGGVDAFLAAKKVGKTGRVIGVDMTPAMIERARRTAEKDGYSQVEFRLGLADQLPVDDGSVDVVISNCVINLTRDKGRVFAEVYRVLKHGGRLEVSDMVTDGALPGSLQENPENWAGCVYGALPEGEYTDLIKQAGFRSVVVRRSYLSGEAGGVKLYSALISARKEDEITSACCG